MDCFSAGLTLFYLGQHLSWDSPSGAGGWLCQFSTERAALYFFGRAAAGNFAGEGRKTAQCYPDPQRRADWLIFGDWRQRLDHTGTQMGRAERLNRHDCGNHQSVGWTVEYAVGQPSAPSRVAGYGNRRGWCSHFNFGWQFCP